MQLVRRVAVASCKSQAIDASNSGKSSGEACMQVLPHVLS